MNHPLRDILSIDVDADHTKGWPGGLDKLARVRVDGRPIVCAFFDPKLTNPETARPVVTTNTMKTWRGYGRIAGMRYDPRWDGYPAPEVAAKNASDHIERLQPTVVEYDVETHDVTWQVRFLLGSVLPDGTRLKGVRGCGGEYPDTRRPETLGYRWGRPFVYTFEGRQAPGTCAAAIAAQAGGLIGPQPYNGKMDEHWDMWWEYKTWCRAPSYVDEEKLLYYYDADKRFRPGGVSEGVLFATSRLTELYV